MHLSHVAPHIVRADRASVPNRQTAAGTGFSAIFNGEITPSGNQSKAAAASTHEIKAQGTPNNLLNSGDLLELGGGVYYNTAERNYQDISGSIVGTNPAAVQQYTDPETYLASGAAYQPSDAQLEQTVENLEALVPKGMGSPTFILNARWSYEQTWGKPPLTVLGQPAWAHQAEPVALVAFPGVLKAPGPPPLAGALPTSLHNSFLIPDQNSGEAAIARAASAPTKHLQNRSDSTRVLLASRVSRRSDTAL